MIRNAFAFTLKPDCIDEYERRHNPIWPDLEATLKAHGAHNYSIFYEPGSLRLFGYVEVEDEARWDAIANTEICQRWWAEMKDLMESNPDNSPASTPLREVFHMA